MQRLADVEKHQRMAKAIQAGDGELASRILLEISSGFERHFEPDGA